MNNTNSTIRDFDINTLDAYEKMVYDDLFLKGNKKEDILRILINQVEGDFSQLSEGLREIAEHPEQAVKEESQDNSKERFTSGEWVAMNKTGTGIYKIVSDTLQEICETQMPYGDDLSRPEVFKQGEANARLIAQAPDMYRLLLDARKLLQLTEIIHKSVECGKVAKNITSLLNRIDNK